MGNDRTKRRAFGLKRKACVVIRVAIRVAHYQPKLSRGVLPSHYFGFSSGENKAWRERHRSVFHLTSQTALLFTTLAIRPCHTVAILSRETKRTLFYHAKPRSGNHGDEAWRGKTN